MAFYSKSTHGGLMHFFSIGLKGVLLIVLTLLTSFKVQSQIKAEQFLIGTGGNQGNYPGGGNISWTIGEVIVFSGLVNGETILGGMQSYPICYQNSVLSISGTSASLCSSVPVVLSVSGTYANYQWYLNDGTANGKIVGATSASYTPVTSGTYSVFVKMVGGLCSFTSAGYSVNLASGVTAPTITTTGDTLLTSSAGLSYEWYVDDRRIIGETSQNYHLLFNGKYQVKVRYPGGCMLISKPFTESSKPYDITRSNAEITDSTVFFPKEVGFNGLQIHPNPTPDFFTLTYYSSSSAKPNLQIINGQGQVILEMNNVEISNGYKKFTVDLSQFPRAVYIVKLTEGADIIINKIVRY